MKILLLANSDWFHHRFNAELAATLRDGGTDVVLAAPAGPYVERLEAAGHRVRRVTMARRQVSLPVEVRTIGELIRLYRRERPDLVHHFTLKCALYGSLAARWTGIPAVNSITGLGYLYAADSRRARLLRWLVEIAGRGLFPRTGMIFLNRDDQTFFVDRGLARAERSCRVPGAGVDTDRFVPQPGPPAGPPVVALVGRLLWSKGVGEFVAAARRLREQGLKVRFALVGESDPGNPEAVTPAQLEQWNDAVETWGFQEDMIDVYRRASIVCLPTSYREGIPTVLLEAAACGRPVITTRMPGCRDAVVEGETGILVPPRNVEALTAALAELIAQPERCAAMGERARERAVAEFSVDRVVRSTLAVYRDEGLAVLEDPDRR